MAGVSPPASERTKITSKFLAVRCLAVFAEQIFVEIRQTPQAIPFGIVKAFNAISAEICPQKPIRGSAPVAQRRNAIGKYRANQ